MRCCARPDQGRAVMFAKGTRHGSLSAAIEQSRAHQYLRQVSQRPFPCSRRAAVQSTRATSVVAPQTSATVNVDLGDRCGLRSCRVACGPGLRAAQTLTQCFPVQVLPYLYREWIARAARAVEGPCAGEASAAGDKRNNCTSVPRKVQGRGRTLECCSLPKLQKYLVLLLSIIMCLHRCRELLSGLQVETVVLPDGEQYKNLETLSKVWDEALKRRLSRSSTFLALGGGVIGDMTGFAAAAYQRGVKFIQVCIQ